MFSADPSLLKHVDVFVKFCKEDQTNIILYITSRYNWGLAAAGQMHVIDGNFLYLEFNGDWQLI